MIPWLLAIGALSILGQVALLRELNVAFYGSELIYILSFGGWLLWTATGVLLGRRAYLPSDRQVRWLLTALGIALPISLVLVRAARRLAGGLPGAYLPFLQQLVAMGLALLPVGLLLGLLFQWVAKLYVGRGRTLARAYAIESAGGLAGGILATLFLRWGVQNLTTGLLCGLLALMTACWPWSGMGERRRSRPLPLAIVGTGLLLLALLASPRLDRWSTAWNHPHLLASRDSPYGRVTVTETGGQIAIFENDALAFESEGTSAEEFVHLAALQHAAPESILILGGGVEGLVAKALEHRPRLVDYVELNRVLFDLLVEHLPGDIARALADKRVQVRHADPRRYLNDCPRYDLILVGMPEPSSGQTNRFYTREFFRQCADRLGAGGVLAFRLRAGENLWTPQQARRAASIRLALGGAFSSVVVLPGVTNIVLASNQELLAGPELLAARLASRKIEARLVSGAYLEYLYTNDRFAEVARLLTTTGAPANSDVRPICYQYTLVIWLSQFFPVLTLLDLSAADPARLARFPLSWLLVLGGLGLLLLIRRRPGRRRVLLAAAGGLLGMILETVLILHYQMRSGVLYQDLGLLLTAFMAGLALGALALDRLAAAARPVGEARTYQPGPGRTTGGILLGGFVCLALLVVWLLRDSTGWEYLPLTALLLLASGFLVAGLFAYASLLHRPDQRWVISPLYAADLLGGCFGSVVASLLLVPVLGLIGAALLVSALALVALMLI